MTVTKRKVYFFPEPGEANTDLVVEAIGRRVEVGDLKTVVVASNSGLTAVKVGRALKGKAKVLCIGYAPSRRQQNQPWPTPEDGYQRELTELGVDTIEDASSVFDKVILYESRRDVLPAEGVVRKVVRKTLYTFGQGFKVAVEVVLMAVAAGRIEPYQDVIGVGGSGEGADTAIIVRATYPAAVFAKDSEKRLEVREIIAMPLAKKWWD